MADLFTLRKTNASCPTCDTLFEDVEVERDERGAYSVLELRSCPLCTTLLCACCDQFACDGCGETFCYRHVVILPNGNEKPLRCCPACAAECEQYELPAPMPPARETRIAAKAEVA